MKTAVPGQKGSPRRPGARNAWAWFAAGLLPATGAVFAADPAELQSETASLTPVPLSTAGDAPAPGSRIEISTSNLPRFDNFDGTSRTRQRIDMALLSPGRSAFGVTMGLSGPGPSRYGIAPGAREGLTGVNLGLQWRYTLENNRSIDIRAWRDLERPNDALSLIQSREPRYGARVEMRLSGSRSPLVAERGFIGLQLDGGARITLKRSGGKPMIYYRNKF